MNTTDHVVTEQFLRQCEEAMRENEMLRQQLADAQANSESHLRLRRMATEQLAEARESAARYERLRILGVAPYSTSWLEKGMVIRFQSLDAFVDNDIEQHPSRGETCRTSTAHLDAEIAKAEARGMEKAAEICDHLATISPTLGIATNCAEAIRAATGKEQQ